MVRLGRSGQQRWIESFDDLYEVNDIAFSDLRLSVGCEDISDAEAEAAEDAIGCAMGGHLYPIGVGFGAIDAGWDGSECLHVGCNAPCPIG